MMATLGMQFSSDDPPTDAPFCPFCGKGKLLGEDTLTDAGWVRILECPSCEERFINPNLYKWRAAHE